MRQDAGHVPDMTWHDGAIRRPAHNAMSHHNHIIVISRRIQGRSVSGRFGRPSKHEK